MTELDGNLLECPGGINVIGHGANTMGKMKSGIAKSIVELWPAVAEADRDMHAKMSKAGLCYLGEVLEIKVSESPELFVVNLYQQATTRTSHPNKIRHVDYEAVYSALVKMEKLFPGEDAHFGFPKNLGCGLAGGEWTIVKSMIDHVYQNRKVTIVNLKQ